jgi:cell division ATPase FtsA
MPEFVVNGHGVKAPIGMSDIRLEAKVHIVPSAQRATDNIIKIVGCFKLAKLICDNTSRTN